MKSELNSLNSGDRAKVLKLKGGKKFQHQLRSRGLREGQELTVLTRQPAGPLVITVGRTQLTIGQGMAKKVIVEVEK